MGSVPPTVVNLRLGGFRIFGHFARAWIRVLLVALGECLEEALESRPDAVQWIDGHGARSRALATRRRRLEVIEKSGESSADAVQGIDGG
jgi:hypothetical protein